MIKGNSIQKLVHAICSDLASSKMVKISLENFC